MVTVDILDVEQAIRMARIILRTYIEYGKYAGGIDPTEIEDCDRHLSRAYQSAVVFAKIVEKGVKLNE